MITIKELLEYINENIADGVFTEDSTVNISDCEQLEASGLYNDCGELTISAD